MTLAFVVHFFDFRNDVRALLAELIKEHKVVLFIRPEDEEQIRSMAPPHAEIRFVQERRNTLWNAFLDRLQLLVGRLPKSRQNFYLMEIFKISLQPNAHVRQKALGRLNWRMRLPDFLSYDAYLSGLQYSGQTDLSGIDAFFCFTEVADSYLLARLLKEKRRTYVYVYSWDHPCKHTRFSTRAQYLVWGPGMAQDLVDLQDIPRENIHLLGASQFGFIEKYANRDLLAASASPFPFKYIYLGCAIGLPGLIEEELAVVRELAQALAQEAPDWRLVVRPYPVLRDWALYQALTTEPNIVLDDGFRSAQNLSVGEAQIQEKYIAIAHAEAFLHLGTTLGLEACFTDTPSFLIDFDRFAKDKEGLALWPFVHQYQNDKYLANIPSANRITSADHFITVVRQLAAQGKQAYLPANITTRQAFPVFSFAQLAKGITDLLAHRKN
jgi:hypothetical protein